MDILLGFLAGALTLLNPCVLPVLPIVLASATAADRHGPLYLMAGMGSSFVLIGLALARLGPSIGLTPETVEAAAALVMVAFGLVLLVPALNTRFASATAGLANHADARITQLDQSGPWGMALGGVLLGAVWSPCIGPTLGGAIALAASGDGLAQAAAIMVAFALGVCVVMLALAYGARSALQRRAALMRRIAQAAKPVLGVTFVLVGLGLWFGVHRVLEIWAIQTLPNWFNDLSILI
ncbi:cytochrome c biogenesis CcdA family protein [Pararhodobacter zhoushanensis]|uniref:cytochrome c biogenesis CcdA family protein n=1 Tax=Pararhodobacter zhoushanensis TaxID=2479545 RepID=UPI000F8C3DE6|nr:cytochrome c biogenesis CcdA family protein [Pararhodobacter zhoushanensis]